MFSMATFGFTLLNGIYPVLFNLYLLRLEYEIEYIGLVNAIGLLGYALFSLPAGLLADRWGVCRAMTWGLGLATLGFGLQPLVEFVPHHLQQSWILINRLLGAAGISLYFVNSTPFLINATGPDERAHAYSVRMAASTLAGFVGSLVGGALPGLLAPMLGVPTGAPASYRYSLLLAAALCIPAVLALLAIREPNGPPAPTQGEASQAEKAPIAILAIMVLAVLLRAAGVGVSRTFFNVYLDDGLGIPAANIGVIFAFIQLASAPAALAMPLLAKRWGNYRVVVGTSFGTAISLLPLALIPHWMAATLGRLGSYALSSISDPALSVYQMEIVPPRWRTTMAGATSMALGLSWTALAFGGGYLIAGMGYHALFLTAAVLTTAGTLLFWGYFRGARSRKS
jgi:MFS family permease